MVKCFCERYCLCNGHTSYDVTLFTLNARYLTVTYIVKINFTSMNVICSTRRAARRGNNMFSEYSLNGKNKSSVYQYPWILEFLNVRGRML